MTPEAAKWLAAILRAGGQNAAAISGPSCAIREACEWAVRWRLGPLLYVQGCPDPDGVLRGAYLANLQRAEAWLRAGVRFLEAMETAEIPCLPMRGPFDGLLLYNDAAARCFSDLDVLTAPERVDEALRRATELGWQLRPRGMPKAFYRVMHLHYPLFKPKEGIFLDLHWALDHPFGLIRPPVATLLKDSAVRQVGGFRWRRLGPRGEVALACAHLVKEMAVGGERGFAGALRAKHLPLYCDLARMTSLTGCRPDDPETLRAATEWQLEQSCRLVGSLMRELERDEEGFWVQEFGGHRADMMEAVPRGLTERALGFRRTRLRDVGRHVVPKDLASNGGFFKWIVRGARAIVHLTCAAIVVGGSLLVRRMRLVMGAARG